MQFNEGSSGETRGSRLIKERGLASAFAGPSPFLIQHAFLSVFPTFASCSVYIRGGLTGYLPYASLTVLPFKPFHRN
jgi:hypothetical protein